MICISVTPESRKLAKVDLLNASRQGDLIELCLDHLIKPPDMKDLVTAVDKPILVSCRRPDEGGRWKGTDEQRMTLLREAIVAEPAYVELDIETAHKIPRFGSTKRVVSHTSLKKPLTKVDTIFDRAVNAKADVVKFTWPTPTLEAAWPLLAAVTKKRDLPIVGLGLGPAGVTFSLLARKYGSPWIYAALEHGMEAFYGQPTCHDLDDIHQWRDLGKRTRFIGVAGFGDMEMTTVRLFNQTAHKLGLDFRCLPMTSNDPARTKQMFDILKVNAILASEQLNTQLWDLAEQRDDVARDCQYADFFVKQKDGWTAYNTIWRTALAALEDTMGKTSQDERPLDRRSVLVVGSGSLARTLIHGITRRKGMVSISSGDDDQAQQLAQATGARFVSFATMYDTHSDVVILADPKLAPGPAKGQLNPSYLRPPMVVMDVATMPQDSVLIQEARTRGVTVVDSANIFLRRLASQMKSITGQDISADELRQTLGS